MSGIWDRIGEALSEWWWGGHSSTHHNPELPDLARMKRDIKKLRRDGRDDLANEIQRLVNREEKEAQRYDN